MYLGGCLPEENVCIPCLAANKCLQRRQLAYSLGLVRVQEALVEGVESLSQAKVGSALQVFFNLEELQQVR